MAETHKNGGSTMKRSTAIPLTLLLWLALLALCISGRYYHREDAVTEGGVTFYLRADGQAAFAGCCAWDGESGVVEYTVPDTVRGAPVTALGGLVYGTAFKQLPYAWGVTLPETLHGAERAQYTVPEHAAEITLTVRLHIGRYVSHIESIGLPVPTAYYGAAENYVVHQVWQVTCDPLNPTYYAEGGRLYLRADSSPADIPCE